MKIELITPPSSLPVTVDKLKSFMRVLDDDENEQIEQMLLASIKRAENITNRQLEGVATFAIWLDKLPSLTKIKLPKPPLVKVVEIGYRDLNDSWQTLDSSSYWIDDKATPAEIIFIDSAPGTSPRPNSAKITFRAGYTNILPEVEGWLKIMVSTLYEHRERFVIGASIEEFSLDYTDGLLDSLRIVPI